MFQYDQNMNKVPVPARGPIVNPLSQQHGARVAFGSSGDTDEKKKKMMAWVIGIAIALVVLVLLIVYLRKRRASAPPRQNFGFIFY